MNMKFLASRDKKKLLEQLQKQFGIDELPFLLLETGNEKIRGFSGSMSRDEIYALSEMANIELLGLYLFKEEHGGLRVGFDGSMVLRGMATKNFIEIESEDVEKWLNGMNLGIKRPNGIYIIKSKEGDYLGCAASDGTQLINFVPKERRIRRGR